jgi:hypothetical protein
LDDLESAGFALEGEAILLGGGGEGCLGMEEGFLGMGEGFLGMGEGFLGVVGGLAVLLTDFFVDILVLRSGVPSAC